MLYNKKAYCIFWIFFHKLEAEAVNHLDAAIFRLPSKTLSCRIFSKCVCVE